MGPDLRANELLNLIEKPSILTENPNVNIPLLRKAVEWAEAEAVKGHDSAWQQASWHDKYATCGTSYCIAGYVGQLLEPKFENDDWADLGGDSNTHVSDFAMAALGLTNQEADLLFRATNTIEDVRAFAEWIARGDL